MRPSGPLNNVFSLFDLATPPPVPGPPLNRSQPATITPLPRRFDDLLVAEMTRPDVMVEINALAPGYESNLMAVVCRRRRSPDFGADAVRARPVVEVIDRDGVYYGCELRRIIVGNQSLILVVQVDLAYRLASLAGPPWSWPQVKAIAIERFPDKLVLANRHFQSAAGPLVLLP